jgi:hypothetical protein
MDELLLALENLVLFVLIYHDNSVEYILSFVYKIVLYDLFYIVYVQQLVFFVVFSIE